MKYNVLRRMLNRTTLTTLQKSFKPLRLLTVSRLGKNAHFIVSTIHELLVHVLLVIQVQQLERHSAPDFLLQKPFRMLSYENKSKSQRVHDRRLSLTKPNKQDILVLLITRNILGFVNVYILPVYFAEFVFVSLIQVVVTMLG